MSTRDVGRQAEDKAAEHLLGLGYTVVTRRFTTRVGEIDIVALDGDTLVFVEVKWRRKGDAPEQSVGWTKRQRFHQAVEEYYTKTGQPPLSGRYDIVAVTPDGLRHIQDAFRAEHATAFDPDDTEEYR